MGWSMNKNEWPKEFYTYRKSDANAEAVEALAELEKMSKVPIDDATEDTFEAFRNWYVRESDFLKDGIKKAVFEDTFTTTSSSGKKQKKLKKTKKKSSSSEITKENELKDVN